MTFWVDPAILHRPGNAGRAHDHPVLHLLPSLDDAARPARWRRLGHIPGNTGDRTHARTRRRRGMTRFDCGTRAILSRWTRRFTDRSRPWTPTPPDCTTATSSGLKQPYHLVDPSPWPLDGSVGRGTLTVLGIIHRRPFRQLRKVWLAAGLAIVIATMALWWRDVLKESRTPGLHTPVVRLGLALRHDAVHRQRGHVLRRLLLGVLPLRPVPEHVLDAPAPPSGRRRASRRSTRSTCRS